MPTDDAVTVWLGRLMAGDPAAVRPLWEAYFRRLVGLARARLRGAPRRVADEEDVALSAFDSFCRHAEAGRFPDLTDRDSLWHLLATFTIHKVSHHLRDANRLRRGGGAVFEADSGVFEGILSREPDPALETAFVDECERLLSVLGDPELRQIALLRVDGHTIEEIAARIGRAPRAVKRKLSLIRGIWERECDHEPN